MFTREQLYLIEDLLDGKTLPESDLQGLKRATSSALWIMERSLPRKERHLVQEYLKTGVVQIVGRNTSGIQPTTPATKPKIAAKSGQELLKRLGLS